ncbi:uncharacterized protein A1O9_06466 [Exophiala aquamarina CBS 119918]|uniref:Gfd2/YDR514C-like C-terminal domain-containing protein n=1 Tax=Exophiala aquamarina CBS 119918 TaxID=1182545 RepID=A0A072PSN8_9EURO|nr:uncharacterized protein A1O9_06466 [Exophiala aquamarina CBS 119918]KEF58540.1 hypothetical protein A1O9_06466 [Exophiala aquamarina CBS 119918]
MATNAQDRLAKLFAGQTLPTTTASSEPHFFEKEIEEKRSKDQKQPKWQLPSTAKYSRQIPKPVKPAPSAELLTSSDDDDDYISLFSKKPSMKTISQQPPDPKQCVEPQGGAEYIHKGKQSPKHSSQGTSSKTNNSKSSHSASLPTTDKFCQFNLVSKFPYKYMNDAGDRVSRHFFANNKFFNRTWDLYYLNPPYSLGGKPLALVPHAQVQDLVMEIGKSFKIDVSVPEFPFTLSFRDDGTPKPQFLGVSQSRDEAADLQSDIPAALFDHGECPAEASATLKKSFKDFKQMCQEAMVASKKKGAAIKKKKEADRLLNVGDLYKQLRRCQRYLGLRPRTGRLVEPDPILSWYQQEDFRVRQLKEARIILDPLDVRAPTQYPFDKETVLISIDVEAYERAHNLITEIGVSTLDTLDLVGVPPGPGGVNWIDQIRSRHFRIKGREHLVNRDFCPGNPDAFQFGDSEFIDLSEAAAKVDACFQWPFSAEFKHAGLKDPWANNIGEGSAPQTLQTSVFGGLNIVPSNKEQDDANRAAVASVLPGPGDPVAIQRAIDLEKAVRDNLEATRHGPKERNILIVGHAIGGDLEFLKEIGSKIFTPTRGTYPIAAMDMMGTGEGAAKILASILEALDTGSLYRIVKRETQTRNLKSILSDLGRPSLHLHNGGNDARYTLEALVAMAVKARLEDDRVPQKGQFRLAQDFGADEWNKTVAEVAHPSSAQVPAPGPAVSTSSQPVTTMAGSTKSKKEDLDEFEAAILASSGSEASLPRQTDKNLIALAERIRFEDDGEVPKSVFAKNSRAG